jgi:hypothetical protein
MASAEPVLEPGEHVVFRTALHPIALSGAVSFAAFSLLVATLLVVNNDLPPRTNLEIVVVGLLAAASGFVRPGLRVRHTRFVVTERRFLASWGAFRRRAVAVDLAPDVVAAERTRRWVDAGTVAVASGDEVYSWAPVARPEELVEAAQPRRGGRARDRRT